ncbi:conserved hypothetical protein [uncultured Gammaproteobacteria bacterium]
MAALLSRTGVGVLTTVADGVRLVVRVTPRAGREAITGLAVTAEGGRVLKVALTAVPEDGKANKVLVALLAKSWRVPKTSITVIAGATDRNKVLHIAGDPETLAHRLCDLLPTEEDRT